MLIYFKKSFLLLILICTLPYISGCGEKTAGSSPNLSENGTEGPNSTTNISLSPVSLITFGTGGGTIQNSVVGIDEQGKITSTDSKTNCIKVNSNLTSQQINNLTSLIAEIHFFEMPDQVGFKKPGWADFSNRFIAITVGSKTKEFLLLMKLT